MQFYGRVRDGEMAVPSGTLRVGVTGGTGFIGLALLRALRAKKDVAIRAIVRESSNVVAVERVLDAHGEESGISVANLMDSESMMGAVRDCDVVVHLAAVLDGFVGGYGADAEVTNAKMGRAVACGVRMEAARRGERIRLIHVSSTETIGITSPCGAPADETVQTRPDSAYGRGKLDAEREMRMAEAEAEGELLQVCILRPTGVYGVDERFFFRELVQMCESGLGVLAPSPCTGRLMLTHVDDVVAGIILALHATLPLRTDGSGTDGVVLNICPNGSLTYKEIVQVLNEALGRPGPFLTLPSWAGRMAMRLLAPLVYGMGQRRFLYHTDSVKRTCEMRVYSNKRAKEQLGFIPKHEMVEGMTYVVLQCLAQGIIPTRRVSPLLRYFTSACVVLGAVLWRTVATDAEAELTT